MEDKKKPAESSTTQDYVRVLSHQLKTPINSIQSLLRAIAGGYAGDVNPKALSVIDRALNRAEEAKEMISDLLDLEMYSQWKTLPEDEFDLIALCSSLAGRYGAIAADNAISMHTDLPLRDRLFVMGDRRGFEHALRNILDNAVKYTPPQGSITFKLEVSENEKKCRILVADTGPGIGADEREKIFDPFYRSVKTKANTSGTGLGLAIAKRVIERHSGAIAVKVNSQSAQGSSGTLFTIELPYTRSERCDQDLAERRKVLIIGGVTAGPKAAARLRRLGEELDITIIEKSEFLSYTGCGLPYYISGNVKSAKALMSTADNTIRDVHFFESIKNINTLNNTVALSIDRAGKKVRIRDSGSNQESEVSYDTLILATGASSSVPDVEGIDQEGIYSLHSIEDAETIKRELSMRSAQDVYIIGGGLVGISTAQSLLDAGARVTILEKKSHILLSILDRDMAGKIENELSRKGIKIITSVEIKTIRKTRNTLAILIGNDSYAADMIILSAGVTPNTALAVQAGLEIGDSGGIKVNRYLQTSDENIYAIGDCAESINLITRKHDYWPLGSISTKMGRIAADNIAGKKSEFEGSIGTVMFRIFDINTARTGLTMENAVANGFDVESVTITGLDRAHYLVDSKYLFLKVLADRRTRIILGAQGYGKGETPAKIDILACAITRKMTLEEIFKLDLGYAPAFNKPIDIAQTACLVLNNKIDRLFKTITAEEFDLNRDKFDVVDVGPLSDFSLNSIPGSVNIPLENIRREDLPFDKRSRIVLYSKTSAGAYEAYMYLVTRGYEMLSVLEGGFLYWER